MPTTKRAPRCQAVFDDNSRCRRAATHGDFCQDCAADIDEEDRLAAEAHEEDFQQSFKRRLAQNGVGERLADLLTGFCDNLVASFSTRGAPRGQDAPEQDPRQPPRASRRPPPAPEPSPRQVEEQARLVLGFPIGLRLTLKMIQDRKRVYARLHHPDAGGDTEVMQRINAAADYLEKLAARA